MGARSQRIYLFAGMAIDALGPRVGGRVRVLAWRGALAGSKRRYGLCGMPGRLRQSLGSADADVDAHHHRAGGRRRAQPQCAWHGRVRLFS